MDVDITIAILMYSWLNVLGGENMLSVKQLDKVLAEAEKRDLLYQREQERKEVEQFINLFINK